MSVRPTGLPGRPIQALSLSAPPPSASPSLETPDFFSDELAALEDLINAGAFTDGVPLAPNSPSYQNDAISGDFQGSLGDPLQFSAIGGLEGDAGGYGASPLISGDSQTLLSGDIFNLNSPDFQGLQGGSSAVGAGGLQGRDFGGLDLGIDLEAQPLDPATLLAADLLGSAGGLQGGAGSLDGLQLNSGDLGALQGASDVYDLLQADSRRFSRSHVGSGSQFNSGGFGGLPGGSGGYRRLFGDALGDAYIEKADGLRLGSIELDDLNINLGNLNLADLDASLGDLHLNTAGFATTHLNSGGLDGVSLQSGGLGGADASVGGTYGSGLSNGDSVGVSLSDTMQGLSNNGVGGGVSSSSSGSFGSVGVSLSDAVQGLSNSGAGGGASISSNGSFGSFDSGSSIGVSLADAVQDVADGNVNAGGVGNIGVFDSVDNSEGFDIVGSIGNFDSFGSSGVSLADAVQDVADVNVSVGGVGSVGVSLSDAVQGLSGTSTGGGGSFDFSLTNAEQGGSGVGVSVGVGGGGSVSGISNVGVSLSDAVQANQQLPSPTAASGIISSSSSAAALDSLGQVLTENQSDITDPGQSLGSFLLDINGKDGIMVLPASSLDAVTNGQLSTAAAAEASLRKNFEVSVEVNDDGLIDVDVDLNNDDNDVVVAPSLATILSTSTNDSTQARSGDSVFVSYPNDSTPAPPPPTTTTTTTTTTEGPPRLAEILPNLLFSKGQFFGTLLGGLAEIGATILKAITEADFSAPPPRQTYGTYGH